MSEFGLVCPVASDPERKMACTPGNFPNMLAQCSAFFIRR